jgi:hypothetical protein
MDFSHYNDEPVQMAVDLVNTFNTVTGEEKLVSPDNVSLFVSGAEANWCGPGWAPEEEDLHEVRALRSRLRSVFEAASAEDAADIINAILSDVIYALANAALAAGVSLSVLIQEHASGERLDYDPIHGGTSVWRLLTPIDHPDEPARCLVSGTGLTHLGSAKDRQAMHELKETELTDSMKKFRWGVEGGRPDPGKLGTAPEWFYKGNGTILRAHGES